MRERVDPSSMEMMIFIYRTINGNIKNSSSPVFGTDFVVWGYRDPAMSSLFLHIVKLL